MFNKGSIQNWARTIGLSHTQPWTKTCFDSWSVFKITIWDEIIRVLQRHWALVSTSTIIPSDIMVRGNSGSRLLQLLDKWESSVDWPQGLVIPQYAVFHHVSSPSPVRLQRSWMPTTPSYSSHLSSKPARQTDAQINIDDMFSHGHRYCTILW